MIRALVLIAAVGLALCVATLMSALAIAGPDAFSRGGWEWVRGHHDWDADDNEVPDDASETRTFTWIGGNTLEVRAPAEVRYVQKAGPASLTISGPARLLDRVRIEEGGQIRASSRHWGRGGLRIVLTAPDVSNFRLSGANKLTIEDYDQDTLSVKVSGASEVDVAGQTRAVSLDISGAGDADLGRLKAREAEVEISGAGEATIAPTERARLAISGMGEIELLTRPGQLETDISGAGRIRQPPASAPAPTSAPAKTSPTKT